MVNKYYCGNCKKDVEIKTSETIYSTKKFSSLRHVGAYCKNCGRWIKWLSQEDYKWQKAEEILKQKYGKLF